VIETTVAGLGDVLDLDQVRRRFIGAREHDRGIERRQGDARVTVASRRDGFDRLVGDGALAKFDSPSHEYSRSSADNGTAPQRGTAHQRRIDLEVRVLGRRADEHDLAGLGGRQQEILLGLIEPVDLVNESTVRWPVRRVDRVRA